MAQVVLAILCSSLAHLPVLHSAGARIPCLGKHDVFACWIVILLIARSMPCVQP